MSKLIILRGPSGSGKTTTAKRLFDEAENRTVLIEQDYYRFIFNPPGGGSNPNSAAIHEMLKNDVLIALKHNFDVVLEGILTVSAYREVFNEIFKEHPHENFAFYFNISFEETIKRHKKRQSTAPDSIDPKALIQDQKRHARLQEFGESEMREWYKEFDFLGTKNEVVVPESNTMDDTLLLVKTTCGI